MKAKPTTRGILDQALLDPVTLRVLADPLRSFVLYSLVSEAKTAKQLAAELGCPPTRLYYHLQQLEKHDLVFIERTRLVSGILEKSYRARARDWVLDRAQFEPGSVQADSRLEALLAFVFDQSRLEIRRQVETGALDLRRKAPEPGALIAYRNVLKLSANQAAELTARLLALWNEYDVIAKQPAADGQFYAFTVALYPNAALSEPEPAAPRRATRRKTRP